MLINGRAETWQRSFMEKALLNVKEFAKYLGIGQTKARELLHDPGCNFTVKIGNRLYANKLLVDKWLFSISGNKRKKGY